MSRSMLRHLAAALPLLLLLPGCGERAPAPAFDVILVSIDTLRADRLGAYGYPRATSPALDAFAARGVLFERAVAECSWTLPSHVTMMSGLYPSSHAIVKPALRIGAETPLLAEALARAGFRTHALTDGGYVGAAHGFDRGFTTYDEREDSFSETIDDALAWIDAVPPDERYFLFLHTYDVHCPYDPSPAYRDMFTRSDSRRIQTAGRCGNPFYNTTVLRPGEPEYISDQYDASIREMDDALGRLFDHLASSNRLDRTIVLVTSDHGEELQEHGRFGHERSLYRETLMIPFVLVAPGLAPARVPQGVGLVDVAPTILALLDLPVPGGTEGRTLVETAPDGSLRAADLREDARVSELDRHVTLRSVMTPEHHLIRSGSGRAELYSVRDSLEVDDIAGAEPAIVRALGDSLASYARARTPRVVETIGAISDEARDRLRSLGYID